MTSVHAHGPREEEVSLSVCLSLSVSFCFCLYGVIISAGQQSIILLVSKASVFLPIQTDLLVLADFLGPYFRFLCKKQSLISVQGGGCLIMET